MEEGEEHEQLLISDAQEETVKQGETGEGEIEEGREAHDDVEIAEGDRLDQLGIGEACEANEEKGKQREPETGEGEQQYELEVGQALEAVVEEDEKMDLEMTEGDRLDQLGIGEACEANEAKGKQPEIGEREQRDELEVSHGSEMNEEKGEQGEEQEMGKIERCREREGDEPGDGEAMDGHIPCPAGGWSPVAANIIAEIEADGEMALEMNRLLRSKSKRAQISDYGWYKIYRFAVDFNSQWFQHRIDVEVCILESSVNWCIHILHRVSPLSSRGSTSRK